MANYETMAKIIQHLFHISPYWIVVKCSSPFTELEDSYILLSAEESEKMFLGGDIVSSPEEMIELCLKNDEIWNCVLSEYFFCLFKS